MPSPHCKLSGMERFGVVLLAVIGCDSGVPEQPERPTTPVATQSPPRAKPSTPGPPPAPPPEQPAHGKGTLKAKWSRVVTTDTCWFFSGPDGRDTRLVGDVDIERDGERVRLMFGGATFEGTF